MLKIFYTASSLYIVFLMMRVFARTREREKAWRLGAYSLLGSLVAAPVLCPVFEGWSGFRFFEVRLLRMRPRFLAPGSVCKRGD